MLFLEFFFEFSEILYNSVVNDSDLSAHISMRMSIFIRRRPVSRPSGVADSKMRSQIFTFYQLLEVFDSAFFLAYDEFVILCTERDS